MDGIGVCRGQSVHLSEDPGRAEDANDVIVDPYVAGRNARSLCASASSWSADGALRRAELISVGSSDTLPARPALPNC